MSKAKTKNGHPPKSCHVCGRAFEWRKKWARDWEQVRYCSDRCRRRPRRPAEAHDREQSSDLRD